MARVVGKCAVCGADICALGRRSYVHADYARAAEEGRPRPQHDHAAELKAGSGG